MTKKFEIKEDPWLWNFYQSIGGNPALIVKRDNVPELKCVCGNVATEPMMCYVKGVHMGICKSCKWMIDHDEHDVP